LRNGGDHPRDSSAGGGSLCLAPRESPAPPVAAPRGSCAVSVRRRGIARSSSTTCWACSGMRVSRRRRGWRPPPGLRIGAFGRLQQTTLVGEAEPAITPSEISEEELAAEMRRKLTLLDGSKANSRRLRGRQYRHGAHEWLHCHRVWKQSDSHPLTERLRSAGIRRVGLIVRGRSPGRRLVSGFPRCEIVGATPLIRARVMGPRVPATEETRPRAKCFPGSESGGRVPT
jgi:hypothetical protein